jgi:hypothetical protein
MGRLCSCLPREIELIVIRRREEREKISSSGGPKLAGSFEFSEV